MGSGGEGRPVTMSEFSCPVCMGSMPVSVLDTVLIFVEKLTRVYMIGTCGDSPEPLS